MNGHVLDRGVGARMTPQRQAVLRVLADLPGPSTANAIHHLLRSGGGRVGLTTLYRHLASLVDAGVLGITQDREGRHLFHPRTDAHDHYLTCVRCGRTVGVDTTPVTRWAAETAAAHGFADVRVAAELAGLCARCPLDGQTGVIAPPG
ncbi:Fur family transcriptional regulator [Saccharothrix yanglingensis]|uniref:Transcriptional repressor n=1 Tax=Saccharothrix yanglingensis TaxID=659496 RepID=A0ABU0XAI9_9PSEU|nr:Fur family transcriptional regulator [Saccharothrix yanglingensis]MDQ2588966.1 transcriptional repressor [Saccharothrix yanglingensis]